MEMTIDPKTTPALEPPQGEVSNFIDSYSKHYIQIIVASCALFLCTAAVAARSYTRAVLLKQFDLSDWALLLSLACMAVLVAVGIHTGQYGQGRHQWNVTLANMLKLLELLNIIEILYSPVTFFTKYVVLRQIETLFLAHRRDHFTSKGLWVLIWANLVFYTCLLLLFIFACVPRAKISNPSLDGKCIDTLTTFIAAGAVNLVSDLTILVLPIAIIWNLKIALSTKIGAGAVFAVGIFALIANILRLYYSIELTRTEDLSFAIEPVAIWAHTEFTAVFLVACFPLFPRLVRHFRKQEKRLSPLTPATNRQKSSKSWWSSTLTRVIGRSENSSEIELRSQAEGTDLFNNNTTTEDNTSSWPNSASPNNV
ncbi:hypothetical protein F4779DRAFT_530875 [Xylariaceae sp. FL0662B]|nr:hypothetical protein F4779DRAFT_530875 [Xylariaceae sp. FL0662B]